MEFKDNIPIYLQIEQYLYRQIALGKLTAGEKKFLLLENLLWN